MCQYAWLDRDPEFGRACRVAHRYVEPFIQRAISRQQRRSASQKKQPLQGEEQSTHHHPPRRYCLLDELVQQESNPEKIRDQVMNILVAGRDTTASLLSSLFFILARRSDILAKVQDEVAALAGRGAPTYEDIKAMKYLNYVIKETLRLYPPVPLNTRIANKETTLPLGGGPDGRSPIYIHKNQTVVYQVYSTHRRPDFWGLDANEFKPERWYDARVGFEYIPFNAGPRICPGESVLGLISSTSPVSCSVFLDNLVLYPFPRSMTTPLSPPHPPFFSFWWPLLSHLSSPLSNSFVSTTFSRTVLPKPP